MHQTDLLDQQRVQELNQVVREGLESIFAGKDAGSVLADMRDKYNLNQAEMSRVIEALNVNLTAHHVKTTEGAERSEEHPIVDNEAMMPELYPSQDEMMKAASDLRRTVVSDDIFNLNTNGMVKAASAATDSYEPAGRDQVIFRAKAAQRVIANALSRSNDAYENAVSNLHVAKQKFARSIVRMGAHPADAFAEFAVASLPSAADDMSSLFGDIVVDENRGFVSGVKQASNLDPDVCSENIQTFIDLMEANIAVKTAAEAKAMVIEITDGVDMVKTAFNLSSALVNAIDRRMLASSQATDAAASRYSVYNPYNDPEFRDVMDFNDHLDQMVTLEKIRNSDEILSRTDPKKVYAAYNDVFATSPESARNPALVRTILRQHVEQGGMDPLTVMSLSKNNADVGKAELGQLTYHMDRNDARKDEIKGIKQNAKRDKRASSLTALRVELDLLKEALDG